MDRHNHPSNPNYHPYPPAQRSWESNETKRNRRLLLHILLTAILVAQFIIGMMFIVGWANG